MAQKGRKKPSKGEPPRRKGRVGKGGKAPEPDRPGSGDADWIPGTELSAEETERILDVDPAREIEDKAREFGPLDNPFQPREEDRLPEENPFLGAPEEEGGDAVEREKTRPERDDYAPDPGRSGLVEGSSGPAGNPGESFLDSAARAGQGRTSAEDVLKSRMPLPGSGFLDALFLDFPFPANMEAIACHLAQDAHLHGGPAETFHDLVIQLDRTLFKNIQDLKSALGDRFAWEASHGRSERGNHGR